MSYTNFAYYFHPHGWIERHNPRKFYLWGQRNAHSELVRDYCLRKSLDMVIAAMNEREALYRASGRAPCRCRIGRPAMSINHMRDGDTCYYDDELAASCGL